jgi:hypothetical protein
MPAQKEGLKSTLPPEWVNLSKPRISERGWKKGKRARSIIVVERLELEL